MKGVMSQPTFILKTSFAWGIKLIFYNERD